MWLLRCRDSILEGLELERGRRFRIARWIGLALWAVVLLLSSLGGWIVEKLQTLGVIATLAVGWLLPCKMGLRTRLNGSCVLHYHIPRPITPIYSFPEQESPTASVTTWQIREPQRPICRCAPSEKGASITEAQARKKAMARSDRLPWDSSSWLCYNRLEFGQSVWSVVNQPLETGMHDYISPPTQAHTKNPKPHGPTAASLQPILCAARRARLFVISS